MTLICLGWNPWGSSWKRNQSMVYQLSRLPMFERVVFVNPRAVWVGDELRSGDGSVLSRIGRIAGSMPRRFDRKIRICSMVHFVPLKTRLPQGGRLEQWMFRALMRSLRGKRPYILLNNHPNFFSEGLLKELMDGATLNVFDISDDFVEFFEEEAHRRHFQTRMEFCCSHSDVVFTNNDHVKGKYGRYNPNTFVITNSTNYANFHRDRYRPVPFLEKLQASGRPILGCTGIINRVRMDYELLEQLVRERPEWEFVFLGSADRSFLSIVERYPNLHHHEQVPYDRLPDWIEAFDAAIIPFRVNEHTRGNDLLKFNDYLAMGKNVVTTNMGGARRYEGLLWIAEDTNSFLSCAEQALDPPSPDVREKRKDVARTNSWDQRVQEIQSIMMDHLRTREGTEEGDR